MNASRSGRSKSPHPQTPITRAGHFGFPIYSGGQNQDLFPFYSRPTGAFFHQNLIISLLTHTAWCLPTCLVRRWSPPATAQLPRLCQSRRCTYSAHTFKFPPCRPQWAEARRTNDSGFARRNLLAIFQEGVPRNWGLGGKPPMSARCAKALIEGGPRRFFGSFLIAQKGTSPT